MPPFVPPVRRTLAIALTLALALTVAAPLPAQDPGAPSIWDKLRHKKPHPTEETGPLATLRRKLAEAKRERELAQKMGAAPPELHRMDARIAGIEELSDLISRRQTLVRAGRTEELAALDRKILDVRQGLRKVAAMAPDGAARFDMHRSNDLWTAPHGSKVERAYQEGDLRRSMGI